MPKPFSPAARLASFRHAIAGLAAMFTSQHNAWLHAAATVLVVAAGFVCDITRVDWLAITLVIAAVWTAEAVNTSFESLCDVVSPQQHPQVKRAKDIAAAAVLICALASLVVAALIFVPAIRRW